MSALSMDAGSCVPPGDHDNQIIELWSFECHRDNQHVRVHFQRDDHAVGGLDESQFITTSSSLELIESKLSFF